VRSANSPASPLRVVLLGLGTVGGAVATRLVDEDWRRDVAARGLEPPELIAVGLREPERPRSVKLPESIERSAGLAALAERADVDVVIELLGGLDPAGPLIRRALAAGKSVVTANKFLLAERGPELEATARRSGAALRFEAAVAGGIPILAPLARDLAGNRIERVRGIVNGTTNFILTAMAAEGRDYAAALADAQQRGYAEADPSADVEGRDAAHKLVLLARLAFGVWVQPSGISRAGITAVTAGHVSAATAEGLTIKLVASVGRTAGGRLAGFVEPCAVPRNSVIGATDGVTNVVEVTARPLGTAAFRGPGAGGDATSSAVLADLLALARGEGSTWATLPPARPVGELDDGRAGARRWNAYRLLED
jgi:homoserine dehydrogenase